MQQHNGTAAAPPSADMMAQALEEYLAAAEAGTAPPREQFLARYPELAEDLDACLAALHFIGRAAEGPRSVAAVAAGAEPVDGLLGDFRLIREVGRGGMGVVYEATQVSLGRRVALKVLPFAGTLDPKQLQRFKNEAQAAAQLHHTNIVPVHFVCCERGVHFYAMQFIDGQTLAELIGQIRQAAAPAAEERTTAEAAATELAARQPTLATGSYPVGREHFRTVARLGAQAAEALDHAHQAGVVHRDVKPGNLLLETSSPLSPWGRGAHEGLRLWVTDFGLAHVQSEASLTMTGDLVGTLRYMSPEQALARRVVVDHRTDIYSLGVTLYELLTLRPPFAGNDRQELLRQIAFEEPQAPRRMNKAIPAELEIIVLKAMAKSPAERYATAQEMADDLRRFLDDKAIQARRPTLRQRLGRWSRRHQALVRSAVVVLLLAVVGLTGSTVLIARARQRTKQALAAEAEQRRIAEEKAAETGAVVHYLVNDLLGSAAPEQALGRKVTVQDVLANGEEKIDRAFTDQPRVEAAVSLKMGITYAKLAQFAQAERHLRRAGELYTRWNGPEAPETLRALNGLANVLREQGHLEEARKLHEEVLGRRRKVLGEDHLDTLASLNNLAIVLAQQGKPEDAQRLFEETLALRRRVLGEDHPETLDAMANLAVVIQAQGKADEARQLHEEVLRRKRNFLPKEHPDMLDSMLNLAGVLKDLGRWEEAERLFEETLTLQRRVLGENHRDTLGLMNNLALVLEKQGKLDEARQLHEEVLGRRRVALGKEHPDTLASMYNVANMLRAQGNWEQARRLFEETLTLERRVLGENHPETLKFMDELGWLLATCADPRQRGLARATELARKTTSLAPQNWTFWRTLGVARYCAKDWQGAWEALNRSMELRKGGDSSDGLFLAMAHWQLGEKAQARTRYDQAVRWMEKNRPRDEELLRFRAEAAALLGIHDAPPMPEKAGPSGKK
jgi:serine/threonine protein kinase/Tfp pilus assembly protein PilF